MAFHTWKAIRGIQFVWRVRKMLTMKAAVDENSSGFNGRAKADSRGKAKGRKEVSASEINNSQKGNELLTRKFLLLLACLLVIHHSDCFP